MTLQDLLLFTRARSNELAEYLEAVAASPFSFEGEYPIAHSSSNHVHLWMLENRSDSHAWIDTDYKVACVKGLMEQWRIRLKGLPPYRERGYRMYLYEDTAPTLSVVAETDIGFPYRFGNPIHVKNISEILSLYSGRSWKCHFANLDWEVSQEAILKVIKRHAGSIGKPTANVLGLGVGTLRKLIINMDLGDEVNAIRKYNKRSPADFSNEIVYSENWHIFERILPAAYD
jgi:hypothetical protein